jgi:hypothetical protein
VQQVVDWRAMLVEQREAARARVEQARGQGAPGRRCHWCAAVEGAEEHAKECGRPREGVPAATRTEVSVQFGGGVLCQYCGKVGHYAISCPHQGPMVSARAVLDNKTLLLGMLDNQRRALELLMQKLTTKEGLGTSRSGAVAVPKLFKIEVKRKFDGKTLTLRKFFQHLAVVIRSDPAFENDSVKVTVAGQSMEDGPADWFARLLADADKFLRGQHPVLDNWKEFSHQLEEQYSETRQQEDARYQLNNLRMGPGRFREMVDKFKDYAALVPTTKWDLKQRFLKILPSNIRNELEREDRTGKARLASTIAECIKQDDIFKAKARRNRERAAANATGTVLSAPRAPFVRTTVNTQVWAAATNKP